MTDKKKVLNVGLVMPIAPIDGCNAEHWIDVKRIIHESLTALPEYKCDPKIVSEGNSVGLIHKRIVEGLYTSDIIVCDVSCKNPNVMFELGMRLAFDKPTVIIKDDQTDYSFDTGVIEHLQYPRDLRYKDIVEFKEQLAAKVKATYEDSLKDPSHSPFLKSFGTFKVASIKESEVSSEQFIVETLKDIQSELTTVKGAISSTVGSPISKVRTFVAKTSRLEEATTDLLLLHLSGLRARNELSEPVDISELVELISKQLRGAGFKAPQLEIYIIIEKILNLNNIEYIPGIQSFM